MIRAPLITALALLLLGSACAAPEAVDLRGLLRDEPLLDGWTLIEEPAEYGPDELYDYLDGGAERYLSYGFRRLLHLRYQRAGDPRSGITLDLFDMGSDLGAFGIYSMARRPEVRPEAWGVEGWSDGDVAHAWKGVVYLHGLAEDPDHAATSALRNLMRRAAERIPGEPSWPQMLDPLPVTGRVPQTERYVASDLLGFSFLGGGVLASYRLDGREVRLSCSDLGSAPSADDAVVRLRNHWLERGGVDELSEPGRGGFRYSDAELGSGVVVAAGPFVAVVSCDRPDLPVEAAQGLLADLVARLARTDS